MRYVSGVAFGDWRERRTGMICSGALHVVVALIAIFGLPHLTEPPPDIEEAIPVTLTAQLSEKTTPAPRQVESPKPVDQTEAPKQDVPPPPKPEPPKVEPPTPAPPPPPKPPEPPPPQPKPDPPKPPPPTPAPPPPPPKPDPVPEPAPVPKPKPPEPPPPPPQPKPDPPKPPDKPKRKDDFMDLMDSDLKNKDLTQPKPQAAPPSPAPQPQAPVGGAKQNVASTVTDSTAQPTMSEKDFLKTQVERCWNFDPGARDSATLVVKVHILINADGTVTSSTFDGDMARYAADQYYRAAADSARRAPLSCSPLKIPPGRPDFYKQFPDITLTFDPRSMVR